MKSSASGIIIIESNGCIKRFNAQAERIWGYTEAEVMGKNVK